jgi:deazaflavin-dependent oxidoreductase (nitroreductase family)
VPTVPDSLFKIVTSLHEAVFKATSGRLGGKVMGMEVLILHAKGRKSGQVRSTMLTAPIVEDGKVILVASKGGAPAHPVWFLNLEANPDVEITMGGKTKPMTARVATKAEKDELWPRITTKYKGYAGYQTRTDRDIPVVILEPRS